MTLFLKSRWLAVCVVFWLAVILYSSTDTAETLCDEALGRIAYLLPFGDETPGDAAAPAPFWVKKLIHVILFIVLAALLSGALGGARAAVRIAIVCAAAVAGSASEAVQLLYPGREPMLRDVLLNTASGALGSFLFVRKGVRREAGAGADRLRCPRQSCESPQNL